MRRMITDKQIAELDKNIEQLKYTLPNPEQITLTQIIQPTEKCAILIPTVYKMQFNEESGEHIINLCILAGATDFILDIDADEFISGKMVEFRSNFNVKCETKMTENGLLINLLEDIALKVPFENGKAYSFLKAITSPLDPEEIYMYWNNVGARKNWVYNFDHPADPQEIEDILEFQYNTNNLIYIGYEEDEVLPNSSAGINLMIHKGQYLLTKLE